ncbi:MAG: hypothetical protein ABH967_00040 [Patescibacteria group bacterium]
MLEIISIGINVLFVATVLFFVALFYMGSVWSEGAHPNKNKTVGFLVSMLFSFKFFLRLFFIILLITILVEFYKYLPQIL